MFKLINWSNWFKKIQILIFLTTILGRWFWFSKIWCHFRNQRLQLPPNSDFLNFFTCLNSRSVFYQDCCIFEYNITSGRYFQLQLFPVNNTFCHWFFLHTDFPVLFDTCDRLNVLQVISVTGITCMPLSYHIYVISNLCTHCRK